MNNQKFIIDFLKAFFRLFQARLDKIKFYKDQIIGNIIWNDTNELQEFSWDITSNNINYESTIQLINYLIQHKLIDGDKIIITKYFLVNNLKNLKWDLKKINDSLDFLCSIRIAMIDDGEITDYFLIHF